MKIIDLVKLVGFLREINKNDKWSFNFFEIDKEIKYFIAEDNEDRIWRLDGLDDYYLDVFKSLVKNKINSEICSPPLEKLEINNYVGTCFSLKEVLKWDYLKEYEEQLKFIQEEVTLTDDLTITEKEVNSLITLLSNSQGNESLNKKVINIRDRFNCLKNS